MTTQIQPVITIDDLDCTPDDGNKYELIEGEIYYWVVDPENRAVDVYQLRGEGLELAASFSGDDEMTSAILPGFRVKLTDLFRI